MFFGIVAFGVGLYQMIALPVQYGVNLRYQQPTVANGSIKVIFGFLCIAAGIYRWLNRKRLIKDFIRMEQEERKSGWKK